MDQETSYAQLHQKVAYMGQFIDLERFIRGDKNSLEEIVSYYRVNAWAYRRFHSQDGFMHFRISPSGKLVDEDVYRQPNTISQFIKDGDLVMELGFGQGANLFYLARRHPNARFYGVDLSPLTAKDVPENVTSFQQDYSDLSRFDDNSVDVVYAVETIVHNSDKEKIYKEVCRILKPDGVVIVFDYALRAPYNSYDPVIQEVVALISKGAASSLIESLDELNSHYLNSGLVIEENTDYTRETQPDLKRLEHKADKIMSRPKLAKWFFKLFHEQFVSNVIVGYLGYDFFNAGIGSYQKWVLRKKMMS